MGRDWGSFAFWFASSIRSQPTHPTGASRKYFRFVVRPSVRGCFWWRLSLRNSEHDAQLSAVLERRALHAIEVKRIGLELLSQCRRKQKVLDSRMTSRRNESHSIRRRSAFEREKRQNKSAYNLRLICAVAHYEPLVFEGSAAEVQEQGSVMAADCQIVQYLRVVRRACN